MAVGQQRGEAVGDAFAEIVEPAERRRAAPRHEDRDRALAVAEIEPPQRRFDRGGDGGGIDRFPSSGSVGAITGTLRSGSVSSGETKIVLPDTCIVYCEAPITVARMRASGRASCGPQSRSRVRGLPWRAAGRYRRTLWPRRHK